jgi:hypothetical protein
MRTTGSPGQSGHAASWRAGYAVRRDWPDGVHDFVGFCAVKVDALRFAGRDCEYWSRGPVRPRRYSVLVISRRDFDPHARRHECRSPDCPVPAHEDDQPDRRRR